jgi:hypothetical protein
MNPLIQFRPDNLITKEHKDLSLINKDYTKVNGSLSLRKSFSIILKPVINFVLFLASRLFERNFNFIRMEIRGLKVNTISRKDQLCPQ